MAGRESRKEMGGQVVKGNESSVVIIRKGALIPCRARILLKKK